MPALSVDLYNAPTCIASIQSVERRYLGPGTDGPQGKQGNSDNPVVNPPFYARINMKYIHKSNRIAELASFNMYKGDWYYVYEHKFGYPKHNYYSIIVYKCN